MACMRLFVCIFTSARLTRDPLVEWAKTGLDPFRMLLPNSEFYPNTTKHRVYRVSIQATNSRFSNRRLPLDQFGNSIVSVGTL